MRTIAKRLLNDASLQRYLASICTDSSAIFTRMASSSSPPALNDSTDVKDSTQKKLHVLKCTKVVPTPVSQAVAFMISKDQIAREQLHANMHTISNQLMESISSYSSTELSAFSEACRQIGYVNKDAFTAILNHLAPTATDIAADELPSLLWAGARLATDNRDSSNDCSGDTALPASQPTPSSSSSSSASSSNGNNSDAKRTVPVPQNDGVAGSVSSGRIAGQPGLLQFVLGASQVLTSDVDDVATEELPVVTAALADMEYRDPFLLTALAEAAMDRKAELSDDELLLLICTFANMGRWFFDNRLLDQLTAEVVARAREGKVDQAVVSHAAAALNAINHKNKALQQYLTEMKMQG